MSRVKILELQDAAFGYGASPVVTDVNLSITAGEVVAILGPNGSGKSTLVKGLLGLTEHQGGTARLLGEPLDQVARSRIGYVPQRHTLATSIRASVAEIVAIGRLPYRSLWRPWRRDSATDRQITARALDLVGLGDRASADVSQLSGGQQRRVLIARALASTPDMLIMDEPTAGVDQANQQILAGVLGTLAGRGTTMLIVTHEVEALAHILTRVLVIDSGRIVFDGPPADYLQSAPQGIAPAGHHGHCIEPPASPKHLPVDGLELGGRHA